MKTILVSTDFSDALNPIYLLSGLARHLDAEIMITYVSFDELGDQDSHQQKVNSFLGDAIHKTNYDKLYYEALKKKKVDDGLAWLAQNGSADMLAMVHRHANLTKKIFQGSQAKRLAEKINIPLLIFPSIADYNELPHF